MARRRSKCDELAGKIAGLIRASRCEPREVVDALMAVAAGRAVASETHEDCQAFENHAHEAFHSAMSVLRTRIPKGGSLVN